MVMVKIINHNPDAKTYKDYVIDGGASLELPKADAKAFIRKFEGVDWIRPTEVKKKSLEPTAEVPQVKVGERGDI